MFKRTHHNITTGLDIGNDTMKILVALEKPDQDDLEVLSQITRPCAGVRKGVIIKPEKVTEEIISILGEAENTSGEKIDYATVNIDGSHVSTVSSKGTIAVSRADRQISQEDIDRVIQAAQTISLPSNKEIIDVFPKEFIVDGEGGIKEILGMKGTRLEADVLLLCALSPYLHNLTKAVGNAGLNILDVQSSPIAAARSVLSNQQKELGVVLIDIGATTTGLAVYEEENLVHTVIFPIGAAHITHDIAIGLKCEIDLAEKIKKEFGTCIKKRDKKEKYKRDKIKISEIPVFSRKMLITIIEARVSEIFDLVSKELKGINSQKLPAGIVITGGGAKLTGLIDLAKKELKLPCKIGKPKGFLGLDRDPSFATVSGLALKTLDSADEGFSIVDRREGIGKKFKKVFRIFIP